jgi:DNA mismatch repair ATPase MutL
MSTEPKDVKAMIKEAVQEALEEEKQKTKAPSSTSEKTSGKKEKTTTFDESRRSGMHLQDPRAEKTQWPSFGQHHETRGSNRFGMWSACRKCGIRMMYTPAVGRPATSVHQDLPATVTEALANLRSDGYQPQEVDHKLVKYAIKLVTAEKVMKGRPPKNQTKAKAKGYPSPPETPQPTAAEVHVMTDSDTEGFQSVQPKSKK